MLDIFEKGMDYAHWPLWAFSIRVCCVGAESSTNCTTLNSSNFGIHNPYLTHFCVLGHPPPWSIENKNHWRILKSNTYYYICQSVKCHEFSTHQSYRLEASVWTLCSLLCRFMAALWLALRMDRDKQMEVVHVVPKMLMWMGQVDPTIWCMGWGGLETDTYWDVIGAGYGGKAQASVCKAPPKPPDNTMKYQRRTVKGFWDDLLHMPKLRFPGGIQESLIQCKPATWKIFGLGRGCYILEVIAQRHSTVVMPRFQPTSA
jgi:hypothetical protein